MSEKQGLSRILIVRNGETTAWGSSEYILEKGEIGVGFYKNGDQLLPIIKVGDGQNLWVDLPQSGNLLTEDLVISSSFGRHKAEQGVMNAGGKGMYLSDWIKDALCYKTTRPEEMVVYPSIISLEAQVKTDTGTLEPGSKITSISWIAETTNGHYVYGAFDPTTNTKTDDSEIQVGYGFEVWYISQDGQKEIRLGGGLQGEGAVDDIEIFLEQGERDYGYIRGTLSWNTATNFPLNNYKEVEEGYCLQPGTRSLEIPLRTDTAFAPCLYGAFDEKEDTMNSDLVRKLNAAGSEETSVHYTIPAGMQTVVIACLADYEIDIYNKTAAANMTGNFTKTEVVVAPGNAKYKVYSFTPVIPYIKPTLIKITWR